MAWTQATFVTSFDAEVGTLSTLATTAQKTLWFNEGMSRLLKYKPLSSDLSYAAADRTLALPSGFVSLQKLIHDDGFVPQSWRVHGSNLILDDPEGATEAGSLRVYYWGEWTVMSGAGSTELSAALDYACLYYALSRFYRLLSSNRMYYKRYATLVGANAVSPTDLQQEADRYYQDFLDAREDAQPLPPARFYEN